MPKLFRVFLVGMYGVLGSVSLLASNPNSISAFQPDYSQESLYEAPEWVAFIRTTWQIKERAKILQDTHFGREMQT